MITTVHIAPGVYIRVVPISDTTPANLRPNLHALFLFTSEKGPANEVVYVPNREVAARLFGNPEEKRDRGLLYLLQYVDTHPAFAVRLVPADATIANFGIALVPVYQNGAPAQDANGNYIFTFKFVFGELTQSEQYNRDVVRWIANDQNTELAVATQVTPNDITNPNVAYLLGVLSGDGPGAYYNAFKVTFATSTTDSNLVHLEITRETENETNVVTTIENASLIDYVDTYGYQRRLDYLINDDDLVPVKYHVSEYIQAWLRGDIPGPNNIVVRFMDPTNNFNWVDKPISEVAGNIGTGAIILTALTNYATDHNLAGTPEIPLLNGSEGSLFNTDGTFRWDTFCNMVTDALLGTTNVLPDIIGEFLVEDSLFIKYIFDPTDERAKIADPNGYLAVKTALRDFALRKWNTNTGCLVIGDEGPVMDVLNTEPSVRDFLYVAYVSYSETAVPEYNRVSRIPHVYHVAKDLPKCRVNIGYYVPFAGIDAALHSGIQKLVKEYTLGERDILTEKSLCYIIRDEYGYYTDLDRTTNPQKNPLSWMYVVEMLIDIKYEVAHLCKPWKHKLETAQWDRLKQIISDYVLKPRQDAGYITDYNVKLVVDRKYIDQNLIPIEIELRPAREIERIVVTIYVR